MWGGSPLSYVRTWHPLQTVRPTYPYAQVPIWRGSGQTPTRPGDRARQCLHSGFVSAHHLAMRSYCNLPGVPLNRAGAQTETIDE